MAVESFHQFLLQFRSTENPAAVYAATRNAIYQSGKKIEIMANYQPKLHNLGEWWKQLYGESECCTGRPSCGLMV